MYLTFRSFPMPKVTIIFLKIYKQAHVKRLGGPGSGLGLFYGHIFLGIKVMARTALPPSNSNTKGKDLLSQGFRAIFMVSMGPNNLRHSACRFRHNRAKILKDPTPGRADHVIPANFR